MAGIKYWDVMYDYRDIIYVTIFFDPLKMSLEMAHKVIVPQKKKLCPAVS